MKQFYFRITPDGAIKFHCSNFPQLLNYRANFVGTNIGHLIEPESVSKLNNLLLYKLKDIVVFDKIQFAIKEKSPLETVIHFEREGREIHCFGNVVVESLNEVMIKRLNQLERISRLSPGAIYQFKLDPSGVMTMPYLAEKAFELFNITEKEQSENPSIIMSRVHDEDLPELLNMILDSARNLCFFKFEGRVTPVNGVTKWFMAQSIPERLIDGTIIWEGVIVDITARKSLEEQLRREQARLAHASRMSELGKMAGGIAHEINNPLQAIQMNAERLLALQEENRLDRHTLIETSELIIGTAKRVGKIVRGLKDFSRDGARDNWENGSVQKLIIETANLCRERIKQNGIILHLPPLGVDMEFYANSTQLSQVLLSLINNSFDAVRGKKDPWIRIDWLMYDDRFVISVTDSGPGLPEEVLSKIMQPFFTTKPAGEGTGLGLSIALSIVEKHGGLFYVDRNCPNTRFCIDIPHARETGAA